MEEFCHVYKPAKLLICFLGRHRGDLIMDISKKAGAPGGDHSSGSSHLG